MTFTGFTLEAEAMILFRCSAIKLSSLIKSLARSPIIITGAFGFPLTMMGIMEASTTRSFFTPCTRRRLSTTASGSNEGPKTRENITICYYVGVICRVSAPNIGWLPNIGHPNTTIRHSLEIKKGKIDISILVKRFFAPLLIGMSIWSIDNFSQCQTCYVIPIWDSNLRF